LYNIELSENEQAYVNKLRKDCMVPINGISPPVPDYKRKTGCYDDNGKFMANREDCLVKDRNYYQVDNRKDSPYYQIGGITCLGGADNSNVCGRNSGGSPYNYGGGSFGDDSINSSLPAPNDGSGEKNRTSGYNVKYDETEIPKSIPMYLETHKNKLNIKDASPIVVDDTGITKPSNSIWSLYKDDNNSDFADPNTLSGNVVFESNSKDRGWEPLCDSGDKSVTYQINQTSLAVESGGQIKGDVNLSSEQKSSFGKEPVIKKTLAMHDALTIAIYVLISWTIISFMCKHKKQLKSFFKK